MMGLLKVSVAWYLAGAVVAAMSDVVSAAIIAGVFSMLNTALLVVLHVRTGEGLKRTKEVQVEQQEVRKALTAPRRLVYDQEGNPIGTVLDLRATAQWDDWLTHNEGASHSRRSTDPTPEQAPPVGP